MKKKFFLLIAVLSILFLSGCEQNIKTPKFKLTLIQPENGSIQVRPSFPSDGMIEKGSELTFTLSANSGYKVKTLTIDGTAYSDITDNSITKKIKIEKNTEVSGAVEEDTENPPAPLTKYKVTVTQPANGSIQVRPSFPSDGMIEKGSERTFTLSANTGYKVKELIIGGITYSDVTDNSIIKKVKIEKDTAVSAVVEAEASQPAEQITIGNSVIYVTKDEGGNIIKASGDITLDKLKELAEKSTNNIVINTDALTIKSFDDKGIIGVTENNLQAVINKLSVLNIENQDFTKQSITLNIENNKLKITSITGNISLQDIMDNNEETTEIAKYIAKKLKENSDTNFDSSNLTINTFYKTKRRGTPSRDSSQRNPEYTYESTPITPKFLKETKLNALNKAVLNFKDGDVNVPVAFKSTLTDYFDVNEFYKDVKTGKLNILKDTNITVKNDKPNSIQILLRDLQETITSGKFDITPYIKADQILELINNEKLTDALVIGDMYVTGNVKDLLPKLVGKNDGIKFLNVKKFTCPGPNVTEYDGGENNIEPLPVEQLLEFRKRTDILEDEVLNKYTRSTRIQNLVLNNIDTTTMSQENLELLNFERDSVGGNITFKNSNLSKMQYKGTTGPVDLTFDETILPVNLSKCTMKNLTLNNAILPNELENITSLSAVIKKLPLIDNSLKIHNLQNSFLYKWTKEEIEQFKGKRFGPEEFVGPRYIWDKFLYKKETEFGTPTIFIEDNTTGSIQKRQSQLLALLQTQNKSRG